MELEEAQKLLSSSLQEKQQSLSDMQSDTDVLEEEISHLSALKRKVNIPISVGLKHSGRVATLGEAH